MGNIYHEWDGTTLIVTSDSGTSSCDLKGSKGDMGIRGPQGEPSIIADSTGAVYAVKKTVIGESVTLNNVSPEAHNVDVKVSSKNIIPYPYADNNKTSEKGLTFTNNNGVLTINGTATAEGAYTLVRNGNISVDGKYVFSGVTNGTSNTFYLQPYVDGKSLEPVNTKPVKYEWHGKITQVSLFYKAGAVFNNVVVKPQIEKGTVATTHTPYVADLSTVTITAKDAKGNSTTHTHTNGETQIPAISPTMTLTTNNTGVLIEAEYRQDLQMALDGFVPKVTTTSDYDRAYFVDTKGVQRIINIGVGYPHANTLVARQNGGQIQTGTPTEDRHAATKKYVDDAVANAGGGGSSWQEGYVKEATEYIVDIIYDEGGEDGKLFAEARQVHLVLWRSNGYTPVIPMLAYRYYDGYTEDCIGVINARFDFNKSSDESGFLTMDDGMYDSWFSNMDGGEILSDVYNHDGEWTFEVLASKM